MAITLTIEGVPFNYKTGTLRVRKQNKVRGTLSLQLQSLTGVYRPALDDEIIVEQDGTRLFGGKIHDYRETLIGGETAGVALEYDIRAVDFNSLADRVYVNVSIASQLLKTSIIYFGATLANFGVSVDPAQANGPTLPAMDFPFSTLTSIFDDLTKISEPLISPAQAVVWEIDDFKLLRAFGALDGFHAAPFNIDVTTAILSDTEVTANRNEYANIIGLVFGNSGTTVEVIDAVGTGAGVQTEFPLHYTVSALRDYVNVGGTIVDGVITGGVNETVGLTGSGATWIFVPASTGVGGTITRTSAPTGAILMPLLAGYPSFVVATSSPAAGDEVPRIYTRSDIYDYATAKAQADALLAQSMIEYKEIRYTTALSGLKPGQSQTVVLPKHGLSDIFFITAVEIHDTVETQLRYDVTAIAGNSATPESYLDTYRWWSGSSGSAGAPSAVVVGGAGPAGVRHTAYLGGSRNTSVVDPTWVPVSNYVTFVGPENITTGVVRAEAWARLAGVSVTLRLYNVDDELVAGTSAPITSQVPAPLLFAVTLIAGKRYQLQQVASDDESGAYAQGQIEYGG